MTKFMETEITEQEAELYDRQIRLWGLESQKRLRTARVLICGLNGLGAEVAKNIILAGVKSVTFVDHKTATEGDLCSQFLIPTEQLGSNRAEASLVRAQMLNPMVELTAINETLANKDDIFFTQFDVVVVSEASTKELIRINNTCRLGGIKFFCADLWGMFGYFFSDLQEHSFVEDIAKHEIISKPGEQRKTILVTSTVKRTQLYTPFQDVLEFDYKSPAYLKKIRKSGPAFIVLRILQTFRETEGCDPDYRTRHLSTEKTKLKALRDKLTPEGLITDKYFEEIFSQVSPAAAIVGGALAQDIIKAVSGKEAPHNNIFLFDPLHDAGCGFIETIGA